MERRLSRLTHAPAMNIVNSSVIAVKTLGGVEHLVFLVYDDYISLPLSYLQFNVRHFQAGVYDRTVSAFSSKQL